jgi:hypothetical protein
MAPSKSPRRIARRSTRTPKPSTRKRAQLSQPSLPQRRKKARTAISAPRRTARRLPSTPLQLSTPPQLGQSIEVIDEGEDEDIASSIVEDDDADAEVTQLRELQNEVEEDIMKYPSVWKAIVNGKENLTSRSAIYVDNELYMYMIRQWQDEVIEKARPRQLEVVKIEAIASFERCRAVDECPFDLQGQGDIVRIHEVLRMWYKQRKRISVRVMLCLKEDIVEPQSRPDSSTRAGGGGRRTAT